MSEKVSLRWGILGCGLISGDFVRAMDSCVHPNQVNLLSLFLVSYILDSCFGGSKFARKSRAVSR
jgi:hypothetical protein